MIADICSHGFIREPGKLCRRAGGGTIKYGIKMINCIPISIIKFKAIEEWKMGHQSDILFPPLVVR